MNEDDTEVLEVSDPEFGYQIRESTEPFGLRAFGLQVEKFILSQ